MPLLVRVAAVRSPMACDEGGHRWVSDQVRKDNWIAPHSICARKEKAWLLLPSSSAPGRHRPVDFWVHSQHMPLTIPTLSRGLQLFSTHQEMGERDGGSITAIGLR